MWKISGLNKLFILKKFPQRPGFRLPDIVCPKIPCYWVWSINYVYISTLFCIHIRMHAFVFLGYRILEIVLSSAHCAQFSLLSLSEQPKPWHVEAFLVKTSTYPICYLSSNSRHSQFNHEWCTTLMESPVLLQLQSLANGPTCRLIWSGFPRLNQVCHPTSQQSKENLDSGQAFSSLVVEILTAALDMLKRPFSSIVQRKAWGKDSL